MTLRARTFAGAILLTGCALQPAPVPDRTEAPPLARQTAPAAISRPMAKHACAYELARPPLAIASPVTRPAGAAAGGKVLLAYQTNKGLTTSVHARLFDPAAPPGRELALSPKGGVYTEAEVVAHGSRFFVVWHEQKPDEKYQGRWVEADGTLGPLIDLPFADLTGVGLLPHGTGFAGAYEVGRDHGNTLYRVLLDADLKPTAPPLAVDDAAFISGLSIEQLVLSTGDIWLVAEAMGRKTNTSQIHLVRMGANGAVIGTVDEVSSSATEAMLPALVEVPGGVLLAWLETTREGHSGTLWTRKLDLGGKPLGPPLQIGPGGSRWQGLELVIDAGEPLLVTQTGRNLRLDASGTSVAGATAVEPLADHSIWLATTPPSLAWSDHGDDSNLMFAPLACSRDTVGPR